MVYCIFILTVGIDRPTLKLLNKFIRNDIAFNWEDLGVELLDEEQRVMLKSIAKNKHNVQGRCTELFEYWLDVDIDASWNKLMNALQEINQTVLADKIKRKILKGI